MLAGKSMRFFFFPRGTKFFFQGQCLFCVKGAFSSQTMVDGKSVLSDEVTETEKLCLELRKGTRKN